MGLKFYEYVSFPAIIIFGISLIAYHVSSVMGKAMTQLYGSSSGYAEVVFPILIAIIFGIMGIVVWYMDIKMKLERCYK